MATRYERWNRRQVITDLLVDARVRRRGVARRLLAAVTATAVDKGARETWLETQNVNVPAIRAYQALGFAITGCDTTLYDEPYAMERAVYLSRPVAHQRCTYPLTLAAGGRRIPAARSRGSRISHGGPP